MTAAVYALRKHLNILLVSNDLGGKTFYHMNLPWIQDYQVIRGLEIVDKFRSELEYLDYVCHQASITRIERCEEGFNISCRQNCEYVSRAVILATGTQPQQLNVPGEKEYRMKGLSYSAISYAPLFIERKTAVIGDGELALNAAGELALIAKSVHLVRKDSQAHPSPLYAKLKRTQNVSLLEGYEVVRVTGDEYAQGLVLKNSKGNHMEVEAEAIFIEKGLTPNSQLVAGLVELDAEGRIVVDWAGRTSVPGVFAAGDVTANSTEQVLVAVGEGAKAALNAYNYLLPYL
jgi:alkyl hydroperoxide reductase subunit F